ncbi:MAG TPA: nuclear transport factor 2 family protein [Galbitalea sp.]
MTDSIALVRRFYAAYQEQDVDAARAILSDRLSFTSPQDDHIDKVAYLERCFPTAERFVSTEILDPVEVTPGLVLWRYRYELEDGGRFSNVEEITVGDDRIVDIRVYFGGPLD